MSDADRKIRIGSFDYPLPFLSNLIDSIRDEHTSFSGDMLRMWQDSESKRLQENDRIAQLTRAEEMIALDEQKVIKGDD